MSEITKQQETAWKIVRHPESPTCFYLHDARGEEMAVTYGDEDGKIANRILRAVNSHVALVEACEALFSAKHPDHFCTRLSESECAAIDAIRAAIKLAKGEA